MADNSLFAWRNFSTYLALPPGKTLGFHIFGSEKYIKLEGKSHEHRTRDILLARWAGELSVLWLHGI